MSQIKLQIQSLTSPVVALILNSDLPEKHYKQILEWAGGNGGNGKLKRKAETEGWNGKLKRKAEMESWNGRLEPIQYKHRNTRALEDNFRPSKGTSQFSFGLCWMGITLWVFDIWRHTFTTVAYFRGYNIFIRIGQALLGSLGSIWVWDV